MSKFGGDIRSFFGGGSTDKKKPTAQPSSQNSAGSSQKEQPAAKGKDDLKRNHTMYHNFISKNSHT